MADKFPLQHFPNQRNLFIGLVLAIAFTASGVAVPTAKAQVGPPAPVPKNAAAEQSKVTQSIKNFFKKSDKEKDDKEIRPNTAPANPFGTTTPNILDAASDRSVPKERRVKVDDKKAGAKPAGAQSVARPPLLTQPPLDNVKVEVPVVSPENPPVKLVTLDNPANPFGFTDAESKLNQVGLLIDNKEMGQAKGLLTPLRQSLVDLTEAHIGLYKALSNIPSARAQAELEKQLALQFALLRDKAMYQMGTINIVEKNYKNAIKELTEVIKSQPRSDLGLKSYRMLQEIGFTEKLQLAE